MTEEFLDIVDESNNLTGKSAPRSKIHAEGIWHRAVHIYLFHKNNNEIKFLIHLRSLLKDLYPNKWDTRFGGHIKSGATIEDAVRTELQEEIGLDMNNYNLIEGTWRKSDNFPNCEFDKIYYIEYDGGLEDLKFDDGEVQKVKWMSIDDIKKSMTDKPEDWSASIAGFTEVSDYLIEKIKK